MVESLNGRELCAFISSMFDLGIISGHERKMNEKKKNEPNPNENIDLCQYGDEDFKSSTCCCNFKFPDSLLSICPRSV